MKRAPPAARWWWVDPRRTFVINRVNRVGSGRQAGRVRGGRETTAAATMALGGRGVSGGVSLQSERSNWEWLEWASPKTFHNVSGRRGISANNGGKSSLSSSSSSSSSSLSFIYLIFFFFLFDFLTISFHSFFLGGGCVDSFPFWRFILLVESSRLGLSLFLLLCVSVCLFIWVRAVPERFQSGFGAVWEQSGSDFLRFVCTFHLPSGWDFPMFLVAVAEQFQGNSRAVPGQFQSNHWIILEQSQSNFKGILRQFGVSHFGDILASFWRHFGVISESFWKNH